MRLRLHEVAGLLGVDPATVSRWERRKKGPSLGVSLGEVLDAYGVPEGPLRDLVREESCRLHLGVMHDPE